MSAVRGKNPLLLYILHMFLLAPFVLPDVKSWYTGPHFGFFQSDQGMEKAGYNVQIAVDNKNKLIVECTVTNETNDSHQMTPMLKRKGFKKNPWYKRTNNCHN